MPLHGLAFTHTAGVITPAQGVYCVLHRYSAEAMATELRY